MNPLTREEMELVSETEKYAASILHALNSVTIFKIGDFLVARHNDSKKELVTNSYGAVKKYQVVFVDRLGIPYIKELSKTGVPAGAIIPSLSFSTYGRGVMTSRYLFEVDPEYIDSIILDDQENYNATEALKIKSDAFKDIAKHNKAAKIGQTEPEIVAYVNTLKVGSVIWRSYNTSWIVTHIDTIPKQFMKKIFSYTTPFIKVQTNKGLEVEVALQDFKNKSIYKDRPRTYKELKDPK